MANPLDQMALEQACVNAIIAAGVTSPYALTGNTVVQCFDGQPPPRMGKVFVSVWSDDQIETKNTQTPTYMHECFKIYCGVTILCTAGWDRWIIHRQEMGQIRTAIKLALALDALDNRIIRAANALAGYDTFTDSAPSAPVGFRGFLTWMGADPILLKNGSWWHAEPTTPERTGFGIYQRLKFSGPYRIQTLGSSTT